MFSLPEPTRSADLMVRLNERFVSQPILVQLAPVLADGVPLTFPIILFVWYILGIKDQNISHKHGAILTCGAAGTMAVTNMIIQSLVDKDRPEGYISNTDFLIMDHLPTDPFPSDHAAVSMAFATMMYLRGKHTNNTIIKNIGLVLIFATVVMSLTRVAVAIHRPLDVTVGMILGASIAIFVFYMYRKTTRVSRFIGWIVSFQEWLFGLVR